MDIHDFAKIISWRSQFINNEISQSSNELPYGMNCNLLLHYGRALPAPIVGAIHESPAFYLDKSEFVEINAYFAFLPLAGEGGPPQAVDEVVITSSVICFATSPRTAGSHPRPTKKRAEIQPVYLIPLPYELLNSSNCSSLFNNDTMFLTVSSFIILSCCIEHKYSILVLSLLTIATSK